MRFLCGEAEEVEGWRIAISFAFLTQIFTAKKNNLLVVRLLNLGGGKREEGGGEGGSISEHILVAGWRKWYTVSIYLPGPVINICFIPGKWETVTLSPSEKLSSACSCRPADHSPVTLLGPSRHSPAIPWPFTSFPCTPVLPCYAHSSAFLSLDPHPWNSSPPPPPTTVTASHRGMAFVLYS